ncbi:MAG: sensor histidine kinase [Saprospiraceae bacterium]
MFYINIVLRISLLTGAMLLLAWLWLESMYQITPIVFAGLVILQTYELIRYVNQTNRRLTSFFEAFRYGDFTRSFPTKFHQDSFQELATAMNNVMQSFQTIREEQEATLQYLASIVQHLAHGLLVFNQNGEIITINTAAKQLLNANHLQNIKDFENINPVIHQALLQTPNNENALIRYQSDEKSLSITVSEFKKRDQRYRIVSLKNIQNELQSTEMEAWQNLTRVLTHEIVNSIAPISSTVHTMLPIVQQASLSAEDCADLSDALHIIQRRSDALLRLVQAYRTFTRIPEPHFTTVNITELLQNIIKLYQTELINKNIHLQVNVNPPDLSLQADRELLEAALINLIKNATEALEPIQNPEIQIIAMVGEHQRPIIKISDNGSGIITPALDKIFIPFYSTKPHGSGIGLSYTRKILALHRATIRVESFPNQYTTFTIRF